MTQQIHTYVFTDLEGSTGLTRALPTPVWRRLKQRHDDLVRECATTAGGQVVKSLGDGFLVVFANEEPAIRFAIAIQRALRSEPWRDGMTLEMRIGMDTGPAVFIPDPPDYDGDALNVASRVCAVARPGEVLLSARAYFGARPWLDRPGGEVRLERAGEVRLKGLLAPEWLYRAWAPGLREGFTPLARAGNLAAHLGAGPLIGRDELLAEVEAAVPAYPVLTLVGPGGIGKTRLALALAARVEARFSAGAWVAPLEGVRRGDAVAAELLATLGIAAEGADPPPVLLQALSDWPGLLILDNVEQLVEEESGDFTRLLNQIARHCPRARLLCTSRIDLHLGASIEARFELPPLPVPAGNSTLAALRDCPSAQLCVERLRLRARHFSLDSASAPHVAAICRATDGVPLLIELAAGQLGRRTLPEIARDVERALVSPTRDADRPDRHRDLVRLLDWSLSLLGEERDCFLHLGLFHGGFDAPAAAAVTAEPRAAEFLERLVEAHLVCDPAAEDYLADHPRYRLLNATAAYCRARLGEALLAGRHRHACYYGDLARAAGQDLLGTAPRPALAALTRERDNLAAALETALENGELDLAASIGGPLWELLHRLGLWSLIGDSARRLREQAGVRVFRCSGVHDPSDPPDPSPLPPSTDPEHLNARSPECRTTALLAQATATMALARAARDAGQVAAARDLYQEALDLYCQAGEDPGRARALHGLGSMLRHQNPAAAALALSESLELATRGGDAPLRALNLMMLGLVASQQGSLQEAEQRLAEAVALFRGWEDLWGLAIALNGRARNMERLDQPLLARDLYAESLQIKRELGDRRGMAITLTALARLAPLAGEPEAVQPLLLESLAVNREIGDAWGCAVTLGALAQHRLAAGDAGAALEAAATAHVALQELGGGASEEVDALDALLRSARAQLPADQAAARERRGRETPILRACDAALSG